MDPTAIHKINELKAQIQIIEQQEINKKTHLENNDIDYNLELVHNITCKRNSDIYSNINSRHIRESARDRDLTICLSTIYKILSLIIKKQKE